VRPLRPGQQSRNKAKQDGDRECEKIQEEPTSERFYSEERRKSFGQHFQGANQLTQRDDNNNRRNKEDESTNDRRFDETYFLVIIITPAIPHGAFKMEVTFCVKAVYTPVLDKRVPVIAGPRQHPLRAQLVVSGWRGKSLTVY